MPRTANGTGVRHGIPRSAAGRRSLLPRRCGGRCGLTEQGDVKQAFPLLSRAARAGIAEAEYRVGRCYLEGAGVPPSRAEGARWLERAANQGYVEAQAQLATLAIHG